MNGKLFRIEKRIATFDAIRIFASFSVIYIHVGVLGYFQAVDSPHWVFSMFMTALSSTGVPMFLMLSGYLNLDTDKNKSIPSFIGSRSVHFLIPALFWIAVYTYRAGLGWPEFVDIILFRMPITTVSVHLYFVQILSLLYVLTPVLRSILALGGWYRVLLLGISVLLFSLSWFPHIVAVGWFSFILYYLLGFFIRIEEQVKSIQSVHAYYVLLGSLLGSLLMLMYEFNTKHMVDLNNYSLSYLNPLTVFASVSLFIILLRTLSKFSLLPSTRVIGVLTMQIYYIHPIILSYISPFFIANNLMRFPMDIILSCLTFFLSLMFLYILSELCNAFLHVFRIMTNMSPTT